MTVWFAVGAVLVAVALAGWGFYGWRDVRHARCPKTGNRVRLRVASDPATGWLTDVLACSAFDGEANVSCGKGCLLDCEPR